MSKFGDWAKGIFRRDPLKVKISDIKRDQLKIERRASIVRDEIEDIDKQLQEIIKKGQGQSRETKISLAHEMSALKTKKTQLQKAHEDLMKNKKALYLLEFLVEHKNNAKVKTLANNLFKLSVEDVDKIAEKVFIETERKDDIIEVIEGAMKGVYGEEKLSKDVESALRLWDALEEGEISHDDFFKEIDKVDERLIVKKEKEKEKEKEVA